MTNRPGKRRIAWGRISLSLLFFATSGIVTWLFRERLDNTSDTIGLIATVFSILAAVLLTIISILGDPSMLIDQSWRASYLKAKEVQRRIHRKTDLFVLYIVLLISALVFYLVPKCTTTFEVLQATTFFLTSLSFLFSLILPYDLANIQKERMQRAVDSRKPSAQNGGASPVG